MTWTCRSDPAQVEPSGRQEVAEFPLGAFSCAQRDQHVQIAAGQVLMLGAGRQAVRDQAFHENQSSRLLHRSTTVLQDRLAARVIPVMHHALEQVYVTTRRYGNEEITFDEFTAASQGRLESGPGLFDHRRLVEQDTLGC